MEYKAILFDMDGVLIESEGLMVTVGTLALRDWGLDPKPEDFVPFIGRGDDLYIGGVAEKYGIPYDLAMKAAAYKYFGELVEQEAEVPEGINEILAEIKKRGYKMAVCTSSDIEKVVHNLRAIGTTKDTFDAFVTGDQIVNKKPDPEIYLKGAALLGIDPKDCLVMEDAVNGIQAAHAAGMKAVGITTSFTDEQLTELAGPDYIIHDMHELLDIVK